MSNHNRDVPILDDTSDYLMWKKEVAVWKLGTNAKNTQWASKLIMNMSGKPREVSLNMSTTTLGAADGADELIKELDKIYCKDSTQSLFKAIDQFESYRRTPDEDIDKYILEFQRKYKALKQLQENKDLYGDAILAYRLLNQANLNQEQQRLVRATCSELTYEKMQGQLKRTFGDTLGDRTSNLPYKSSSEVGFKQEPIFYTSKSVDRYAGHYKNDQNNNTRFVNRSGDFKRDRGFDQRPQERNPYGDNFHPNRGYHHQNNRYNPYAVKRGQRSYQQRGSQRPYQQRGDEEPKTSMKNSPNNSPRGSPKRNCFICREPGHLCHDCPFNMFPQSQKTPNQDTKPMKKVYALFEYDSPIPDSIHALIDTGSCLTVCGNQWLIRYLESLPMEERERIYFERYDQDVCFW